MSRMTSQLFLVVIRKALHSPRNDSQNILQLVLYQLQVCLGEYQNANFGLLKNAMPLRITKSAFVTRPTLSAF